MQYRGGEGVTVLWKYFIKKYFLNEGFLKTNFKTNTNDVVIRYQYQYAVTDDYTKSNFQAEEERDGFSTLGSDGWLPMVMVVMFMVVIVDVVMVVVMVTVDGEWFWWW